MILREYKNSLFSWYNIYWKIGVESMATTKDYRDFILEQLNLLDNITCKSMMG